MVVVQRNMRIGECKKLVPLGYFLLDVCVALHSLAECKRRAKGLVVGVVEGPILLRRTN